MLKNRENLRRLVRGGACLAAAVCAWPGAEAAWRTGLVPALSPFNALLAVAAGAGTLFMLGALALAAVCVFRPRAFCRWLCPTGTCQDAVSCRSRRRAWTGRVPRVGAALVFVGAGAALAGYPLFGWLDPLVLFNAVFGLARDHLEPRDWLAAAGLPLLLAAALLAPGLWCGRLCPLGALQDLLRLPLRLKAAGGEAGGGEAGGREAAAIGRRAFLGLGLGAGYRLALPPGRAARPEVIRPPASGQEARFTRLCVRCGACVRACPSGIIRFGGRDAGWSGVLAPEVSFDYSYCAPDCAACGQACPSGAIPRFAADKKFAAPMGLARVDEEQCLLGQNRECGACAGACRYGALDLAWDPVNMTSRVVVDPKACTGCGACEYVCPASPRAIRVKPLRLAAERKRRERNQRRGL